MASFSKFVRGVISDLDIEVILRFRFAPTSELMGLAEGNEDVAMRRLRKLWEWQMINRFAFSFLQHHMLALDTSLKS